MEARATPSQVRAAILDDHRWLREFLAEADALARHVLAGDHLHASRLRERAHAVRERFLRHLELEERHLVPALRDTPGWGEERADLLHREHAAQRQRFDALLRDLRDARRSEVDIAGELRRLVADLLADMAHEEEDLLTRAVLRDEPVVLGEPD